MGSSLRGLLDKITRQTDVNERFIAEIVNELEKALIRSDVNLQIVRNVGEKVRSRLLEEEAPPGVSK
ncbi:MAG: signal recognition particle receptor subunit alpha, partial [Thermoprotei archaeon]